MEVVDTQYLTSSHGCRPWRDLDAYRPHILLLDVHIYLLVEMDIKLINENKGREIDILTDHERRINT